MRVNDMPTAEQLQERDALVMAHTDLVRSMASRLGRRVPSHIELSELISVGVLGLIDAARRFDPALGVPFEAFARRRIHGAMLDSLRRLDRVPRSLRRMQRRMESCIAELRHMLGREPDGDEIAEALGLTPEAYTEVLDDLKWADVAVVRSGGTEDEPHDLLDVAMDGGEGPYAQLERRALRARLAEALRELPDRERQILALSYQEELTLAEIGRVFGVSESRVSQLRTQAIARLRTKLREWIQVSHAA